MDVTHPGLRGLIYFIHQFEPSFKEASLLDDAELLPAVTAINRQIQELAPVLNSPSVDAQITVTSSDPDVPIAAMCKQHDGATYVFAACMRNHLSERCRIARSPSSTDVQVLGESRTIKLDSGRFDDAFKPYAVHLYRIPTTE